MPELLKMLMQAVVAGMGIPRRLIRHPVDGCSGESCYPVYLPLGYARADGEPDEVSLVSHGRRDEAKCLDCLVLEAALVEIHTRMLPYGSVHCQVASVCVQPDCG